MLEVHLHVGVTPKDLPQGIVMLDNLLWVCRGGDHMEPDEVR